MSDIEKKWMKRRQKLFSFPDIIRTMYLAMSSILRERSKKISFDFKERLMLAVTEVNGCPMCSYFHVEQALKSGMDDSQIKDLLSGSLENVPDEEVKALLFAQHYAEKRGRPEKELVCKLKEDYKDNYREILASIRLIMFGNCLGIPFGSLKARIKGEETDMRSSLAYELMVVFVFVFLSPIVFIASIFAMPFR
ncbi:MAG TPA: carboxymuconolactone decarboxylase family protein [Clostridiales bacterium]|nr:carboxymuconolactone decarboxylase family protein [Clostridiales bacterium]